MKIDTTNIIRTVTTESGRNRAADGSFSGILDQALNGVQAGQAATIRNLPPAQFAMPVFVNQQVTDEALQRQAMEHADRILAGLDDYQSLLGNPSSSLKEAGASLDRLEDEIRQMSPMLDKLDSNDPLHDILQSASSLALVEAVKFRRGDYS